MQQPGQPNYQMPQQPTPQQPMGQGYNPYPPEDIESGKTLALLGYIISPLWILPLVQRDNAFALFHAKQAMIYTIVVFVASMIISAVSMITCGFGSLLFFGLFVLMYPWIMGIIYASQGQYQYIPWIGHYADQYFSSMVADNRPGQHPGGGYPPQY